MIGVKINGRLGNQMFQYAFALNCSKKFNTQFYLVENDTCPTEISTYFKLENYHDIKNYILSKWAKRLNLQECTFYNDLHSHCNLKNVSDNKVYEGFFHSLDYFSESQDVVRREFSLKDIWKKKFDLKYKLFFQSNKIIVAHIRRTDYLKHGNDELGGEDLSLPMIHYEKCLSMIDDLKSYKVIFVSDDLPYVKSYFGTNENFFYEENDAVTDFQIIMNADILILANSSFSWWAAFLNTRARRVFAPQYWLGYKAKVEYPKDTFLSHWEQVYAL